MADQPETVRQGPPGCPHPRHGTPLNETQSGRDQRKQRLQQPRARNDRQRHSNVTEGENTTRKGVAGKT